MTNFEVYKKTFIFSWVRLGIDLLQIAVLAGCMAAGFLLAGEKLVGLGIGVIVGLIIFGIVLHFVSYLYKAGQIAMMTGAVTAGTLPDNVLQAGKQAVKERFTTVSVYYVVTSAISGIFHEISRGVTSIANAAGGEAGNTIGSIITGVIDTIVAYLCDCCLGWVFYNQGANAFHCTLQGAVLFFKNWKALLKNLGRIFGMGLASFAVIGGALTALFYAVLGSFPELISAVQKAAQNSSNDAEQSLNSPFAVQLFLALLFAVILWSVLHAVFVRPFVLVGVLRNYMAAGIQNTPAESDFGEVAKISPKFRKLQEKAAQ
jgi:membrane-anchored glycerophosphoryl diester phosphodiesterase (GDPDase)